MGESTAVVSMLRVNRWDEFQHYRDRDPVWIKVYGRLLDDADFLALPEAAQAQLVKLWLVASRCRNQIRDDVTYLRYALHSPKLHIELLVERGFLTREPVATGEQPASTPLAKVERVASPHARPRARGEAETETETETTPPTPAREAVADAFWTDPRTVAFLDSLANDTKRLAWRAILGKWREGEGWSGARPTDDVLAAALVGALTASDAGPLTERFVAACVRRQMRGDPPAASPVVGDAPSARLKRLERAS